MLEEKEEWISSEAPRHDAKMTDVVIEVIAEASQQVFGRELNPLGGNQIQGTIW